MKMHGRTVFSLLLSIELALVFPSTAKADESTGQWDKVVVIGTRTENRLLDSPQAAAVITAEDIENQAAQDIGDALDQIPGVHIDGGPRSLGEQINIRGLGGARVQVRTDGARTDFLTGHKGRLFIDPENIKQIEVLRGGGSALYGSDAIGGVVNIITKDPSDMLAEDKTFGVRGGFQYDSVNEGFRKNGQIFFRPVEEWEYLAATSHWQTGDEIDLGSGLKLGTSQQRGYESLSKLIFHPGEESDLYFTYNRFSDEAVLPGNPASELDPTDNFPLGRDTERELFQLGYRNQSGIGFFGGLDVNVYYHTTEVREEREDGTFRIEDREINTFGFEIKNSNVVEAGEMVHVITYGFEKYKDIVSGNQVSTGGSAGISSFPNGNFLGLGAFLQDEISLFDDRLRIIPAVRWDRFESHSSGNAENSDDQVSPKIGAVYKVTEDMSVFTNYGLGFRAPRLLELYPSGTHFVFNTFVANPNLVPEESRNFEAGVRGQWKRLTYESIFYRIDADDFIEALVLPDDFFMLEIFGTTEHRNVSDAKIWGVENYLEYDLGGGFSTYATFEFTRGKNDTDGTDLTGIMPKNGRWGLVYNHEEYGFRGAVEGEFAGRQTNPGISEDKTAGYAVWDVKLSQKLPWWEGSKVHFGVENVFDKAYRPHLSSIQAPGRNFVVGISQTFQW
ncbi:MAG: TonB-dependent receptor [Candidatus Omnitrophica bacterium]|nr:TonB-dependent receptor [Candidatus Omnitrophota bacterium]